MKTKAKSKSKPDTPFMSVRDAAQVTGLSEYYLRHELAKGNIPHVMSGRSIKINVPALLRKMDAMR
ncbi:MAG: hypothetical protein ACI4JC_05315 [Faecalibacterium sp.]